MNNKDEKTFADLFSSSTLNDNKTEKNFNDILNFNKVEEDSFNNEMTFSNLKENVDLNDNTSEINKDEVSYDEMSNNINYSLKLGKEIDTNNDSLNFNSIFDSVSNVEINGNEKENNLFFDNVETNNSNEDNEVKSTEESDQLDNNLFFDTEIESRDNVFENKISEKQDEISFFGNVEINDSNEGKEVQSTEEASQLDNNLFFDTEIESTANGLENEVSEKKDEISFFRNVETNNSNEGKEVQSTEEASQLDNNLFFDTEIESRDNVFENKISEKQDEISFFGNVEINDSNEDNEVQSTEESDQLDNNLFFDTEIESIDNGLENKISEKQDEISFFGNVEINDSNEGKKVQSTEEASQLDNNLFFDTEIESRDNGLENEVSIKQSIDDVIESDYGKVDINSKQMSNNSTSPFFEEESNVVNEPINVFFQNKINLVENNVPTISNSNIKLDSTKHFNVKVVKKKEPLFKFIIGVLSYAIFIWLLLIGISLLVYVLDIKIRAAKGDYSAPTFNAYVVLTGSMLPDIQVSDVVITKKIDAKNLEKGDIITFASADSRFRGTIITHRIIKKNPAADGKGYTFQTKGDNNNVADSALVPENNIYGKVILKIPKLGYLQEFLASDGGWIIVILIPCLVVISYDTVKLVKGLKRKKYKNIKVQK